MSTTNYTKLNYRQNITMYWQQWYPQWTIPKGYHVHHIKPRCICKQAGWTDEQINHPRNLIVLHPDDHQTIHRLRGDISVRNNFLKMSGYNRLGILASEETKQKMREAAKCRPRQSIETRKKKSQSLTGFKHSQEVKKRMSLAAKNRKPLTPEAMAIKVAKQKESNKDYNHSAETKLKISNSNKGKHNIPNANKGKPTGAMTEENKKLISSSLKALYRTKTHHLKGTDARNKGVPHTASTKEKIKLAALSREKLTCPHCGKSMQKSLFNRWHGDNCKLSITISSNKM